MDPHPLIALTTSVASGGRHEQPQVTLYSAYVRALEWVDLAPVLVTPTHGPRSIEALLARCDGLVLTGGEDVDPKRYGAEPIPELDAVTPQRDEMEFTVLSLAVQRELPILGICRGCQVLNVFFGGTLYQDIAVERPESIRHEQIEPWGKRSHQVTLREGSKLREIVDREAVQINSFHHQAIREPAPSLEVTGVAEDGLIEAVESTELPWAIGVQWHPERNEAHAPATDPDRLLFAAFRGAVLARHEQPV